VRKNWRMWGPPDLPVADEHGLGVYSRDHDLDGIRRRFVCEYGVDSWSARSSHLVTMRIEAACWKPMR
jgi:hypothetical protein